MNKEAERSFLSFKKYVLSPYYMLGGSDTQQ